jgi:hypothetical protein
MNTRRLTKKYKHKSRSKKSRRRGKTRRRGKSRRRVLKGGVIPRGVLVSRTSSRSRFRPSSGSVNRTSGSSRFRPSSGSVRPGSVRPGISKVSCCDKVNIANRKRVINSINNNFHFNDVYDRLMLIGQGDLPNAIESMKLAYITRTTLQPSGAYLNMNGLKFVNYLHSKYKYTTTNEEKEKIKSIISLFDQYGMSHGIRISDLPIVQGQVSEKYFACYKDLYEEIYKKLFPRGNNDYYPVSLSAIPLYCKPHLQTVHEDGDDE